MLKGQKIDCCTKWRPILSYVSPSSLIMDFQRPLTSISLLPDLWSVLKHEIGSKWSKISTNRFFNCLFAVPIFWPLISSLFLGGLRSNFKPIPINVVFGKKIGQNDQNAYSHFLVTEKSCDPSKVCQFFKLFFNNLNNSSVCCTYFNLSKKSLKKHCSKYTSPHIFEQWMWEFPSRRKKEPEKGKERMVESCERQLPSQITHRPFL